MNIIDIFLIIFFIVVGIKGYTRGFIVEVFSLIAFFLGLYLAIEFTAPIAVKYFAESEYFNVLSIAVFLLIMIGLSILINLVAKALKKVIDFTLLGIFDNILGTAFGMLKFALILSVILWIFKSVGLDLFSESVNSSMIIPYIRPVGPLAFELLGSIIPFFKDVFESFDKFEGREEIVT